MGSPIDLTQWACLVLLVIVFSAESTSQQPLEYIPHLPNTYPQEPPEYLHPCHRRHKRFNLCVKKTLQSFLNSINNGSSELNLPAIDPMLVPQMKITQGSGDVILHLKFTNVSIFGLGNTKVVSVRSNLEDNKLEITMKQPFLNILGDYSGEGGVITLPIVGAGDFAFNMTDVSAVWIIYLAESTVLGRKQLSIDNFLIDIIPVEISAQFGKTIDDNDTLGTVVNDFFNENAQEIFKMTKPKITHALSEVFTEFANQVLSRYSSETLLPP